MRRIIFLLALIALTLNANAISVASDYLENDTMTLIEGASKIYSIRLQNPEDYETGIKLDYDPELMKALDYEGIYTLPPKTGYKILFNVTAPKKTGMYRISYTVSEVEPAGGGGVGIRLKISRNFNLKVIEDPERLHINYFSISYTAVLLALAFFLVRIVRRKKANINKVNRKKRI